MSLKEKAPLPEKIIRPVLSGAVVWGLHGCVRGQSSLSQESPFVPEGNVVIDNSLSDARYNLVSPNATPEILPATPDLPTTQAPLLTPGAAEDNNRPRTTFAENLIPEVAKTATPQETPVTLAEVVKEGDYIYKVQSGDSLSKIAEEYEVSLDSLIQANPQIKDIDMLFIGQAVIIPGLEEAVEAVGGQELAEETESKDVSKEVVLPVPAETPLATSASRQGMEEVSLPIDPQAYSLSCELASAEITVLWYNQAVAGGKIAIPEGFKTFEDFFIAEAGLADNPVEGYCGAVNGWLSTSCDASSGAGYGVYNEPLLNGYRKLGIPAEAITIKDLDKGMEQLKQVLIDSYHNNQVLCLWGRWNERPIEWRTNPRTVEQYPMAYGEHCVAGRVMSVDDGDFLIEISDPLPYGSGSKKVYTFDTLAQWMRGIGWFLAVKVG
ncbi:MAG: LysM domain-containing protein [Candidatus Omnitrophica bacterium]|nr:LysM domain-containing protein [Candidatus Omnitrophota bacterium]